LWSSVGSVARPRGRALATAPRGRLDRFFLQLIKRERPRSARLTALPERRGPGQDSAIGSSHFEPRVFSVERDSVHLLGVVHGLISGGDQIGHVVIAVGHG